MTRFSLLSDFLHSCNEPCIIKQKHENDGYGSSLKQVLGCCNTGGIWKEPNPISACFVDGNLVTGAAWPGHPEFLKLLLKALGATIEGGKKKVLMLCGVCSFPQPKLSNSSFCM